MEVVVDVVVAVGGVGGYEMEGGRKGIVPATRCQKSYLTQSSIRLGHTQILRFLHIFYLVSYALTLPKIAFRSADFIHELYEKKHMKMRRKAANFTSKLATNDPWHQPERTSSIH